MGSVFLHSFSIVIWIKSNRIRWNCNQRGSTRESHRSLKQKKNKTTCLLVCVTTYKRQNSDGPFGAMQLDYAENDAVDAYSKDRRRRANCLAFFSLCFNVPNIYRLPFSLLFQRLLSILCCQISFRDSSRHPISFENKRIRDSIGFGEILGILNREFWLNSWNKCKLDVNHGVEFLELIIGTDSIPRNLI